MKVFPQLLVCAFAVQDPSCWCNHSASPLRYMVQAAFKMRNVLPWIKLGLAEISAELWCFLKPTRWDSAHGQRQAVLLGRCRMSCAFSSPDHGLGQTPSFPWLGCTSLELQGCRRRRRRIWAWREGCDGSVMLGSPGRAECSGAEHQQSDRRWHSSAGWLEPLTASLVFPSSPDISFHVGSKF